MQRIFLAQKLLLSKVMKNHIKILFFLLFLPALPLAAQQNETASMPMIRALQSANFEPIMPYMNDRLEITLPYEGVSVVSKKQAKAVLEDFFSKNKMIFAGFQNKNMQNDSENLTYISKTINKTFTIFVVVKKSKIIGIKIVIN